MNDKQTEAMRLADELDIVIGGSLCGGAAAELRRLHTANTELLKALEHVYFRVVMDGRDRKIISDILTKYSDQFTKDLIERITK